MEKFDVSLSSDDFYLINSCLSSCAAQCFSLNNVELGKRYSELYYRLQNLFLETLRV